MSGIEAEKNKTLTAKTAFPALGAAAVWCAAAILIFGARFETNDDAGMANIVSGAFGTDSQYLIHSGVLLGWLLKGLNALLPGFPWYVVFSYLLLLSGFGAVGSLLLSRFPALPGAALYALLLFTAGTDLFCSFQYTKNAIFLVTAGLLLILSGLGEFRLSCWFGLALTLFGSVLRFDGFLPVLALAFFPLLHAFLPLDGRKKRAAVFLLLLAVSAAVSAHLADRAAYRADPGWDYFYRFNEAREQFLDYKLAFADSPLPYLQFGVRADEWEMIRDWNINDPGFFTADLFRRLSDATPRDTVWNALSGFFPAFVPMFFGNVYAVPALLAVLLGVFFLRGRARFFLLAPTLAALGGLFLLHWLGRMLPRVEAPLMLAAALFALVSPELGASAKRPCGRISFPSGPDTPPFRAGTTARGACFVQTPRRLRRGSLFSAAACAAFAVALCVFQTAFYHGNRYYLASRFASQSEFSAAAADDERLYLLDSGHFNTAMGFDLFSPRPVGYFDNIVFLGGWTSNAPFERETMARYGISNPVSGLLSGENVLLFRTDNARDIFGYIAVRYDPGAVFTELPDGCYRAEGSGLAGPGAITE